MCGSIPQTKRSRSPNLIVIKTASIFTFIAVMTGAPGAARSTAAFVQHHGRMSKNWRVSTSVARIMTSSSTRRRGASQEDGGSGGPDERVSLAPMMEYTDR